MLNGGCKLSRKARIPASQEAVKRLKWAGFSYGTGLPQRLTGQGRHLPVNENLG